MYEKSFLSCKMNLRGYFGILNWLENGIRKWLVFGFGGVWKRFGF